MTTIPKTKPIRLKGKAMEKLRRDCFERDGYRCQHSGASSDYFMSGIRCNRPINWQDGHMCHRKSRGARGSDTLDNVFTGCAVCHMKQHNAGGKPVPRKQ